MYGKGTMIASTDADLIERLTDPAAFDHPAGSVQRIETHISWVILTEAYAFKIKKPLQLEFLDFRDLEQRRYYCEEEIRLNKPWAPDIYIDVVPITEESGRVRFGGGGKPVEYAVRMRRFDEKQRLDHQLADGCVSEKDMRELGEAIAVRHMSAAIADINRRDRYKRVTVEQIHDNFRALDSHVNENTLASLHDWTRASLLKNDAVLQRRFEQGLIRNCHGDLHLANLVRMPGGIRTFDCIEFDEDLRIIDIVCDMAFLVMDLIAKGRPDFAALFLNRYLECCGDYPGVALLDTYFVYRCLVRAKVAIIRSQKSATGEERESSRAEAERYCRIALRQTERSPVQLILMNGMSGSGKTWVSSQLMARLPAIRIRSDIERKRLFGLTEAQRSNSAIGAGIYSPKSDEELYVHVIETARSILDAGKNAIIDATFLRREQRAAAADMVHHCGCSMVIVNVVAPDIVMRDRLAKRGDIDAEASEADNTVLDHQITSMEPLTSWETQRAVVFENTVNADVAALVDSIRSRL